MMNTPTDADPPGDVLTTREAARRLGVAVSTVQLWVEAGVLRAWKTAGGHRRVSRESLDAMLAARSAAVDDATAAAASRPFRILVVEDDEALRQLFALTLTSLDLPVQVETAENGFAGLIQLGNQRPDLLITDLNMPGMDGFRMIRHLRESTSWRDLEIIVVTALGPREVEARGELPADVLVLAKPVPFAELERLIRVRVTGRPAR